MCSNSRNYFNNLNWKSIDSAPKDGRKIWLTYFYNGEPDEIFCMQWSELIGNSLVQDEKGIWVTFNEKTNKPTFTWSEKDEKGSPTHWAEYDTNWYKEIKNV